MALIGIPGLDDILNGGVPANHVYLVDGSPGTGKTTLALQFLLEGVRLGERTLYVALSETGEELRTVARSHGFDHALDKIEIFELSSVAPQREDYSLFHPSEVELHGTMDAVYEAIDRVKPQRAAFDSLSEMRLLARDALRYRRQMLALKQFFVGKNCTVLLLDDKTSPEPDLQLHSLVHGVVELEHVALEYGAERRRLQVRKLRGKAFRGGYHDFRLKQGGIEVFPRISTVGVDTQLRNEVHTSNSTELDALLGGGIQCGTSCLITGAAGTGKSVLATQYARAAVLRGEHVQFYLFDERLSTFHQRAAGLAMDVKKQIEDELLTIHQIEPTALSPGEFAARVKESVERDKTKMLVIDSINGYMQSMPEERLLPVQVHELLTYLSNNGVTTIMTLVQRGIFGNPVDEAADVSYLADTVILLRYFEVHGAVRQSISVVKKRSGNHEKTIRECRVKKGGLSVGSPLREFQGVLTGVPQYFGEIEPLMTEPAQAASQSKKNGRVKARKA
jgi:circadian clock protein KaiC